MAGVLSGAFEAWGEGVEALLAAAGVLARGAGGVAAGGGTVVTGAAGVALDGEGGLALDAGSGAFGVPTTAGATGAWTVGGSIGVSVDVGAVAGAPSDNAGVSVDGDWAKPAEPKSAAAASVPAASSTRGQVQRTPRSLASMRSITSEPRSAA
ncbi:hypothetical protein ACEN8K_20675 [Variovorax sp. CT11-76]